jgi:hypothetical protein
MGDQSAPASTASPPDPPHRSSSPGGTQDLRPHPRLRVLNLNAVVHFVDTGDRWKHLAVEAPGPLDHAAAFFPVSSSLFLSRRQISIRGIRLFTYRIDTVQYGPHDRLLIQRRLFGIRTKRYHPIRKHRVSISR